MPLVALCALAVQALAQGQDRQPLQPSSKWVVDYADSECRLTRTFGTGDDQVTLRLARGASLTFYDVVLAGPGLPELPPQLAVDFSLEPSGQRSKIEQAYSMMVPGQSFRFVRWYDSAAAAFAGWTDQQRVTVTLSDSAKISMQAEDGKKALAALATCHDDLLSGWKVDVAALRELGSLPEPRGNPALWILSDDYPSKPLRNGETGITRVHLEVGTDGRATDCRVIGSSGNTILDDRSCKLLLKRARFAPAKRKDGTAALAPYFRTIRWQIPD